MAMAVLKLLRKLAGKVTDKAKKKKERAEKKQKSRETKEKTTAKSTGSGSAFNDPSKIKAGTTQPGTRKPRTKTQKESTTARRMADKEATAKAANVETGKKVLKGAALVGAGAVGGYAAGKSEDSDKPKTDKPKRTNQQLDAFVRESNKRRSKNKTQPEKLKEQLKAESSGDRVKRSNPPKRATVTGKKDDMASRNISNEGKKQANVTREQLERLGLDPKKKSSLTTYLNAYDRLGRRPKSKADLAAKKNMGGMMKKKEAPSRPTGYMDGGMATKTSARGKPKGCGAATGGYGRAML
jgi:hypothetical protein